MLPVRVFTEPVRSAEPPRVSVTTAFSTLSAFSEALRVATLGCSLASVDLKSRTASSTPAGKSPRMRRSNSPRRPASSLPTRSDQACRRFEERNPATRHASRMSEGTSNGSWLHPKACRVAAASSAPSGEPCALALSALFGAP